MTEIEQLVTETATAGSLHIFLIADVRGYTRFTNEHGDEAAARLATKFARIVGEVVAARGGDVIELRGDEALAVFTSARQSLRAASELQERLARETEEDPSLPLPVGIGLDAGEAVPVETGYRGGALNLAARLCALAGPGEVLTSDSVVHLARKIDGLRYAERGLAQLKGFAESVRVIEVVPEGDDTPAAPDAQAAPADSSGRTEVRLPIGGFLGALAPGKLIGRETELGRIQAAIDVVADGSGQLVLLVGEAGVGKTRLAQEATLLLRNSGFTVATGRCYEGQTTFPYYAFREALASLLASAPPAVSAAVPRKWPELQLLLPGEHSAAMQGVAGGQDEQQRLFWSVTNFLRAMADEAPIAVLLDDLHWADGSSLELLQHLARHSRASRVLLLGTYRGVEVGRHHPLESTLRDLQREGLLSRVDVGRLGPEATRALIAETMGEVGVPDDFAALIHRRTEGNPFFVQQLLRVLIERGDVVLQNGHWTPGVLDELEVPESVRSVIGQRLSRLDQETQEILREASVLGETFLFDDLQAMSARSEAELESALEGAATAGLIRETGPDGYAFDHALTQGTLYGELPARRRRRLHLIAGQALERSSRRDQRVPDLARHFLHGGDAERALQYALLAGDTAEAVFAYSEAETHYRSALDLAADIGDRPREAEIQEKLGSALYALARTEEALQSLGAAAGLYAELGQPEGEMRVLARLGWAYYEQGRRRDGIARLLPMLRRWQTDPRLRGGGDPVAAASVDLHVALASLYWGDGAFSEALPLAETASSIARGRGNRLLLGRAESRRGLILIALGRQREGLDAYAEAIELAEVSGDLETAVRTLNNRALVYGDRGERERRWADMRRALDLARRMSSPTQIAWTLVHMGHVAFAEGRWDLARQALHEAVGLLHRGQPTRAGVAAADLAWLDLLEHDNGDAHPPGLDRLLALAGRGGVTGVLPVSLRAQRRLAEWDLLHNHAQAARDRIEAMLANPGVEEQDRGDLEWLLASSLLALGDTARADRMTSARLEQVSRSWDLSEWYGLRGMIRTRQGRWEDAERAFSEALTWARKWGSVFGEARILRQWGIMSAVAGDAPAARTRLTEAQQLFRRLGARAYLPSLERVLSELPD